MWCWCNLIDGNIFSEFQEIAKEWSWKRKYLCLFIPFYFHQAVWNHVHVIWQWRPTQPTRSNFLILIIVLFTCQLYISPIILILVLFVIYNYTLFLLKKYQNKFESALKLTNYIKVKYHNQYIDLRTFVMIIITKKMISESH